MTNPGDWTFHAKRRAEDFQQAAMAILISVENGGEIQPSAMDLISDGIKHLKEADNLLKQRQQARAA